jgi:hypothetical protein
VQPGLGYQYRWDFASDGHYDTEWGADAKATHTYGDDEMQPGMVAVLEPAVYAAGLRQQQLTLGERVALDPGDLGAGWQVDPEKDTPPSLEARKDGLLVRANGARLRKDGKSVSEPEVLLKRGEHLDVGQARLTAAANARVTVRVRNAFGVEREGSFGLVLPLVTERPAVEVVGMAEKSR